MSIESSHFAAAWRPFFVCRIWLQSCRPVATRIYYYILWWFEQYIRMWVIVWASLPQLHCAVVPGTPQWWRYQLRPIYSDLSWVRIELLALERPLQSVSPDICGGRAQIGEVFP